ncbi:MAG: putative metal-dependent HD superfamily phosphohydrolase [Saprospiraceae bacterium]|jgi:predicted metal-dependent HD superfamily phosphohydrolase
MSDKKNKLVKEAKNFVSGLLKRELPNNLSFHNWTHTYEVAQIAKKLAGKSDLSQEEVELLQITAWFHDTGFIKTYNNHEEESVKYGYGFLRDKDYDDNSKSELVRLILSTKREQEPEGMLEEILHDADIAHIGRKRFFRKGELLRAELENYLEESYTEFEWAQKQYEFLINNNFITEVAKQKYGQRRIKNINKQRKIIVNSRKVTTRMNSGKDLGRGIDTMYRANYRNHINFSAIADGKANMMISINTIMISVIITLSGASLSVSKNYIMENLRFTVPILILLIGSLASVVFAILSAIPKVTSRAINEQKLDEGELSLLYFGNFLRIPKQKFVAYIKELKSDQEKLYDSMSLDLYNLGEVLEKKYKLLTISYNIFMTSLILTVLAFVSIFLYSNL